MQRLIVVSAAMQRDGSFPEVIAAFDQMTAHAPQIAQNIKGSPLGQLYPEVADRVTVLITGGPSGAIAPYRRSSSHGKLPQDGNAQSFQKESARPDAQGI